jgi:hypothetical protein
MILCYLLILQMSTLTDDNSNAFAVFPANKGIVIARFACGIILHMQLQSEIQSGLNNMKFALNHSYRFDSPFLAFTAGFLQALSSVAIEVINFIVILTSDSYLNVVMNFMALAIISEFDNAFYSATGQDAIKDIIEDPDTFSELYTITRTSSRNAPVNQWNTIIDATHDTMPDKPIDIRVSFTSRPFF